MGNAKSAVQQFGDSLGKVGKSLTAGLTMPIMGIGMASMRVGMDFEESMAKVAGLSGATGAELQGLEDLAREMGRTTSELLLV
ncbi:MAG: hypothetical protein ACRC28_18730 [Clostridium sp.]|uniref:hypothetical protein n=1 Tax=Clostridium sp. TaxID=1506 RepID=UPI003F323EAE